MKPTALICFLFYCLGTFSQSIYPEEFKKAINNTYKIIYFPDFTVVLNEINPFEGVENQNPWKRRYEIINSTGGDSKQYVVSVLGDYLQNIEVGEDDWLDIDFFYNLNGELSFLTFSYPSKFTIPIELIESLETTLKSNIKLMVAPISPDYVDGVYYIQYRIPYSLKQSKKLLQMLLPIANNKRIIL